MSNYKERIWWEEVMKEWRGERFFSFNGHEYRVGAAINHVELEYSPFLDAAPFYVAFKGTPSEQRVPLEESWDEQLKRYYKAAVEELRPILDRESERYFFLDRESERYFFLLGRVGKTSSFTYEDVTDERAAYHDCVVWARHAQDAGDEETRQKLKARAQRHYERAARIQMMLDEFPLR